MLHLFSNRVIGTIPAIALMQGLLLALSAYEWIKDCVGHCSAEDAKNYCAYDVVVSFHGVLSFGFWCCTVLHHVTDYMAFNHHAIEFIALFCRCLPLYRLNRLNRCVSMHWCKNGQNARCIRINCITLYRVMQTIQRCSTILVRFYGDNSMVVEI